jgi:hypothetical protein
MPNWLGADSARTWGKGTGWPPHLVLAASVAVGALMSLQFLFQVFVWRHWPWDEVMLGWLEVLRDRTVVAVAIGLALVAASRLRPGALPAAPALLGGAIVTGAAIGEFTLRWAGAAGAPADAVAVAGRIARWTVVAGSVAAMSYMWRRARDNMAAAESADLRRVQLERQSSTARLATLRVQIEPHFLFNTLATVRRLNQTEPAQGAQLLDHFVAYLGSAQPGDSRGSGTLGREIELARAYLGVAAARMAGRLQVRFEVAEALGGLEFPPLSLATLVENAVKHGIAPLASGGTVVVSASAEGGMLEAVVVDTGAGFVGSSGSGIGLANIRSRLQTLYGSAGSLAVRANEPSGVRASIRIPAIAHRAPA